MRERGCTPEMAARIVALLMADPGTSGLSSLPPRRFAHTPLPVVPNRQPVERELAAAGLSPEEADAAVALAIRVRSACVLRYESISAAERALGLVAGTVSARLEREQVRARLPILRGIAERLGLKA